MSTPIVDKPDFAKDKAVGNPILPTPITHIFKLPVERESVNSSKFIGFLKLLFMMTINFSYFLYFNQNKITGIV
jgi:hypothetical protein